MTMDTGIHRAGDFISYPTNRVVGTIADGESARAAIEALLAAGIDRADIDVLHGDQDLHRLDPEGREHGFFAQFQRTLIRLAGPAEEFAQLRHHVEDVRAGRFVIMVLAEDPRRRDLVAAILNTHGASFIGFYGRWAWSAMSGSHAERANTAATESRHVFETHLDGFAFRLHVDFDKAVVDATITRPDGTVHHTQGALRQLS